jgi:hypothetical protein
VRAPEAAHGVTPARWIRFAPAVICAAVALPLPLPAAVHAALMAAALGVVPGALAARRLAPAATPAVRALLALALSPFLCAAPAALLVLSGVSVALAARAVAGAVAVLALLAARRPAVSRPANEDDRPAWIAAAAFTAVVLVLLAGNSFLPPRSDGWFHAAVTLQIAGRGLPVEDPAFAGLPLLYFWGPALWCALWLALDPRLAPWTPWIAFNLAAAFATLLGVVALARRLGAAPRAQGLAAALAVLGYAPFAWLMVAARAAGGEVRGLPEIVRLLTLGVDPALRALDPGVLHVSLLFFGDKFLVLTPFALGLALFAAFVLALLDLIAHPGGGSATALAVVLAAAFFTHTLVGFTCALLAGAWWLWALARAARGEDAARRALVPLALAVAAAGVALAPYLLAVAAAKQRQLSSGLSARALASGAIAGALFLPAGFAWLARARGPARELLAPALVLVLLGLGLGLPENNQSKFWNLLFLLLAAPAALAWDSGLSSARGVLRGLLVTGLLVAVVPTVAACLVGFACERGQNEEPAHFPTPDMRAAWSWTRAHTAPDAVVVDAGGASDMLVLAGRSALWGGGVVERDWGHPAPALEVRRRASRELCAGAGLSPDARALLTALHRDVIVVERAAANSGHAASALPGGAPLFRNAAVALYLWQGGR